MRYVLTELQKREIIWFDIIRGDSHKSHVYRQYSIRFAAAEFCIYTR